MNENGSIGGRVLGSDGRPVPHAIVLIARSTTPHRDIAQETDDDGRFRFDALGPGAYEVLVRHDGGEGRATYVISSGEQAEADVRLEA